MYRFTTVGEVAVIDCETTGLDPQKDRIISLAVVLADLREQAQDTRHLEITIDPGVSIPADATKIHGIRNEDVKGNDKFEDVAEQLMDFVSDRPLMGFNVTFDKQFLNAELKRNGFKSFHRKQSYCVMEALHDAWGYRPSLEDAVKRMICFEQERSGLNTPLSQYANKMHDPLNDAYATLALGLTLRWIPFSELENAPGDPWEDIAPTQRQLDYIYDLGGDPSLIMSKRQASEEIDRLLEE